MAWRRVPSGLSVLNRDQIAERAARMARRDDREYREYLREEQRGQPGCPPVRWSLISVDRPLVGIVRRVRRILWRRLLDHHEVRHLPGKRELLAAVALPPFACC